MIQISKDHFITGKLVKIEKAIEPIIEQLNSTGLPIDTRIVEKIRSQYLERQKDCADKILGLVGHEIDLGKRDQVESAFLQEGYKIGKRTNAIVLDRLAREGSNLAALIKRYRQLQRVASGGQSLLNFYNQFLGKLTPIWHQNKALTGRILSEGPCISNISKPYRAAVKEDGFHFIYFDFRNFELRIQAGLASDPVLIEMFSKGFDLHTFTASLILNKDPDEITDGERQKNKSISLGYWYGMGVDGIVNRTGLPRDFVQRISKTLDLKFRVLRTKVTAFEKEARDRGYAETPWGRRMYKKASRGYWALLAQATAADYFKYVLVQVAAKLPDLILLAPLFDGALYKIRKDQQRIEPIIGELYESTTQQIDTFCKMAVDIGIGESWQEAAQKTVILDTP